MRPFDVIVSEQYFGILVSNEWTSISNEVIT